MTRLQKVNLQDEKKKSIIGVLENVDNIDQQKEMFVAEQEKHNDASSIPEVNKINFRKTVPTAPTKMYYPRPTPVDVQFEDNVNYAHATFDGTSIVEWNIDGLSEYQIKTILKYMFMFAQAARVKGNDDHNIAKAIISGFTGQLQGWWDFFLSDPAKQQILTAVKYEPSSSGEAKAIPDAVNTLIYTITWHFIGTNALLNDRTSDQLMNLRCPTLSHFKWYKDVFFSKVYQREDSNAPYWKERFISGLPTLFADRVRNRLKQAHGGSIPYENYTYGDLAAEVIIDGINLCNDIKLKRQLDKQQKQNRLILGDFCEQMGYTSIKTDQRKKRCKKDSSRRDSSKRKKKIVV